MIKKLTAFVLALAALCTMSGCSLSDTSWVAKYDGRQVSAGVYIYYIVQAYQSAFYQVEDMSKDVLKQTVEDVPAEEWIAKEAMDGFADFMATEQEFERLGLSLDESTLSNVDSLMAQMWAYYGAIYEKAGISQDSYREIVANAYKQNEIFHAYYGPGGQFEVPEEELKSYFSANYAKMKYLYVEYKEPAEGEEKDEDDTSLTQEQAIAQVNGYLDQVKAGTTLDAVIDAYNESQGRTVDTTDERRNVNYLQTSEDNQDMPLIEKAFSMPYDTPEVFTTEGRVYLIARYDVLSDAADLDLNRDGLLSNMKDEEFQSKLAALQDPASYTINQDAVNRYSVKKIVKLVA